MIRAHYITATDNLPNGNSTRITSITLNIHPHDDNEQSGTCHHPSKCRFLKLTTITQMRYATSLLQKFHTTRMNIQTTHNENVYIIL